MADTLQQPIQGSHWASRGICLGVPSQEDLSDFQRLITDVLPRYQCNTLVLLVRYQYQFTSHPAVADGQPLTAAQASELAALCREQGIRLIPKMNLLGHQSGMEKGSELGLLRAYPEFDETPDLDSVRYCRSLCPRHPQVQSAVFELGDELIDAFEADAIHVGLDEVFEIGHCPRCKGTPNAKLFADWVEVLHAHFVGERQVEMLMWGDRLLESASTGYGEWEASANDTWQQLDRIPKDILICDWHYGARDEYPSIPSFAEHGFRVVGCPWKDMPATEAFLEFVSHDPPEGFVGMLQTSWCNSGQVARYLCNEDVGDAEIPRLVGDSFKRVMTF